MNITIIGSGNIAHALIACINRDYFDKLFLLTSKPFEINVIKNINNTKNGSVDVITDKPEIIIPKSDLIIFTLPANIRKNIIKKISPFIKEQTIIGSFPGIAGFDEEISELVKKDINIFSSQRVPYIARIKEKGKLVYVDKKNEIFVAIKDNKNAVKVLLENILRMKVKILNNFLEVNLSNSNPILHSARLYDILINNKEKEVYFYREWSIETSEILLHMDNEFMQIITKLNLNIKSLKEHYKVKDKNEMTQKIINIESFKNIKIPKNKNGELDYNSRYFTEDIGVALKYIIKYGRKLNIDIKVIEKVFKKLYLYMEIHK